MCIYFVRAFFSVSFIVFVGARLLLLAWLANSSCILDVYFLSHCVPIWEKPHSLSLTHNNTRKYCLMAHFYSSWLYCVPGALLSSQTVVEHRKRTNLIKIFYFYFYLLLSLAKNYYCLNWWSEMPAIFFPLSFSFPFFCSASPPGYCCSVFSSSSHVIVYACHFSQNDLSKAKLVWSTSLESRCRLSLALLCNGRAFEFSPSAVTSVPRLLQKYVTFSPAKQCEESGGKRLTYLISFFFLVYFCFVSKTFKNIKK